jgi:pyruvate,water dikinase
VSSKDFGLWFIDYSPTLGTLYSNMVIKTAPSKGAAIVTGMPGSSGVASGKIKIIQPDKLDQDFEEGSVLVCSVTTPMYVPLMQKAAAIVTDQGGILSHAAIVARELKKPCIVGTVDATKKLKNGQLVTVDATEGTVTVGL